jgi:hypothetical protein
VGLRVCVGAGGGCVGLRGGCALGQGLGVLLGHSFAMERGGWRLELHTEETVPGERVEVSSRQAVALQVVEQPVLHVHVRAKSASCAEHTSK